MVNNFLESENYYIVQHVISEDKYSPMHHDQMNKVTTTAASFFYATPFDLEDAKRRRDLLNQMAELDENKNVKYIVVKHREVNEIIEEN